MDYDPTQNKVIFCFLPWKLTTEIYKPIISPVILYCCETWSLILIEEQIKRLQKQLQRLPGFRTCKQQEWKKINLLFCTSYLDKTEARKVG